MAIMMTISTLIFEDSDSCEYDCDNDSEHDYNAIRDGCVAPLTMLLTIVIMYHKILSF